MKIIQAALGFALLLTFLPLNPAAAAQPDTNAPTIRVTFELRDGSRLVSQGGDDVIRFHSASLGDLKMAVADIRSVECVSTNSARLTTAKGDTLMVWFADSKLGAKTGFGKIQLAVDSIRKLTVSSGGAAGARRAGLVALWSGDGDGKDSVGGNDAVLTDISFADGKVGQAFSLNGYSSCLKIPASESLDVGTGDGITITTWIKPSDVDGFHPILEWNPTEPLHGPVGVNLWIGTNPGSHGVLQANVTGVDYSGHALTSRSEMVVNGSFQNVAVTYDKASGMGVLYLNGAIIAQSQWGSFVPCTKGNLLISRRPNDLQGDSTHDRFFAGLLDEIAIYNRALSAEEIQDICKEQNNGEPLPPPRTSEVPPFQRTGQGF